MNTETKKRIDELQAEIDRLTAKDAPKPVKYPLHDGEIVKCKCGKLFFGEYVEHGCYPWETMPKDEDAACGCKCGGECDTVKAQNSFEKLAKAINKIEDTIKRKNQTCENPDAEPDGVIRLQVKLCFDGMEFDSVDELTEYITNEPAAVLTKEKQIAYLHGVIDGIERRFNVKWNVGYEE